MYATNKNGVGWGNFFAEANATKKNNPWLGVFWNVLVSPSV
jgi:hypothetical protein